jgi:uncharacterized surface protein with fasciclin (FAS1) repeats
MSNITQMLPNERHMATMNRAVIASGLDQVLSSSGPFTVFAPSDLAFERMDGGVVENLLKPYSKTKLTDLLKHHVIAGQINYHDLKNGQKLKTLGGKELNVEVKDNSVRIDGAMIQGRSLLTSNGVIHTLSKVLQN